MKKKKEPIVKSSIVLSAIASLTLIELMALSQGINGTLTRIITASIVGLVGLGIKRPRFLLNFK